MLRRKAFTLVELLVSVAIIAVLIAMLIPALKKAKDEAVRINCLSNLRSCGASFQMYLNDSEGWLPVQSVDNGAVGYWGNFLEAGKDGMGGTGHATYIMPKNTMCPATPNYNHLVFNYDPNLTYGLYCYSSTGNFLHIYNYPTPNYALWAERPAELQNVGMNPSNSIMLADTVEGFPGYQFLNWNMGLFSATGVYTNYGSAVELYHQNMANVIFFDYHGESMTDQQMRYNTDSKIQVFYNDQVVEHTLP